MSSWFEKLPTPAIQKKLTESKSFPEGYWTVCKSCGETITSSLLKEHHQVCPACGHHGRLLYHERIALLTDPDGFEEIGEDLTSNDPLAFDDIKPYKQRLKSAYQSTGLKDAFVFGKAKLRGLPYFLGVFEFKFMGGSMGVVVGEKIAQLFEHALTQRLPAVIVSSSGGARMQEGILSLMQMGTTTAVLTQLKNEGIPYISILTDPTTGGVAASFAMLGDLILAEPQSLIGFAGPRVIAQTMGKALPLGFQRSEYLLQHGFVDRIVHRKDLASDLHYWMSTLGHQTCRFPHLTAI